MAITELDEIVQGISHYSSLLEDELSVPSHQYNAPKIKELRDRIRVLQNEKDEYCKRDW